MWGKIYPRKVCTLANNTELYAITHQGKGIAVTLLDKIVTALRAGFMQAFEADLAGQA